MPRVNNSGEESIQHNTEPHKGFSVIQRDSSVKLCDLYYILYVLIVTFLCSASVQSSHFL